MQPSNPSKPDIAQLGHSVLKQQAKPVEDILSPECQRLIGKMIDIVEQANGVGIAAPQVYQSLRIFIMSSKPNARYPNAPSMPITAIINPEIIDASTEMKKGWEGCLSVPSLRGFVPRHQKISVRYYDQQAKLQQTTFDGFLARVFQHELDHLDGITFVDRLESNQDLISESEWFKQYASQSE